MRRARAVAAAAVAALAAATLSGCSGISTTTVAEQEFVNDLTIPPLAASSVDDGVRTFHLTAQEGRTTFPGVDGETVTWGFDGGFLGPTLRAARGERIRVVVDNELTEPTSVHWHGMHLPAAMDGGPHQMIEPGATWTPTWTIDQPAATLWYHPHPHGETEKHVYNGLAGMFLLDDDASMAAQLPHEYGVDDLPLIVQDRAFDRDGQFELRHDGAEPGMLGDVVMVNGTVGAVEEVTTERVRLRLLNGSTARTYTFEIPGHPLALVATDGGRMDAPVALDRIRLAPGERAEVVVAFEPGETVRMRSVVTEMGGIVVPATTGANDAFDVLEFRAADALAPTPEPAWAPSVHVEEDALHETDATVTRAFELEGREINGREMSMSRIDEVAYVGDTEVWEVHSSQPIPHSFHIHDVQFRILTIDGASPPPELAGPKDTIFLEPNREYRLLLRFEDYADPAMPYMYHCHMLLHEDEGMMGQFVVIEHGQEVWVGPPGYDDDADDGSPGDGHHH
ncbi:multicopper oxidase domain-containing protein [Microbacterium pseudoresistens]|uniref:FtsP/CotA-like multicopper oxidase with cupredoxin domain n=2 Tax=Microbacterium pseudoresistens TaxID=640634 RepID=A0A7Y9JLN6_9MICO|nr:multicopper oxidase domain-containing protein [Microbacterium pseudoresistens]NYD53902.1 FtsP/CotA-like multicopper oxidase with cupredoxin domain [Microbacterium pseudoresistens]